MALTANAKVLRGKESWPYIYVALGFALSIGGSLIQMLTSDRPWSAVVYLAFIAGMVRLFIYSGWFQDRLIGLKNRIENTPR